MAAMLPGMQLAIQMMQSQLDDLRIWLAAEQEREFEAHGPRSAPAAKAAKPKKTAGYWDSMTAEERSAEIRRRMAGRASKVRKSDARSPQHDQWRENISKAAKKRWADMSPRKRAQAVAKIQRGRKLKPRRRAPKPRVPVVALEQAS